MDILMKGIAAMMAMLFGALILTSLLAFELDRQDAREANLPPHPYAEMAR